MIPMFTGKEPPNDTERDLLALPVRLGGLGIRNPVRAADEEYCASMAVSNPLVKLITSQTPKYTDEVIVDQMNAKASIKIKRRHSQKCDADRLSQSLPVPLKLTVDLAKEKGASNWLTVPPIEEHGFTLHKRAFRDAICLRYGWVSAQVPVNCACGKSFSVQHALSCPKGGYPSIRHNEVRDLTAELLTEVCSGVAKEPMLQPVSSKRFHRVSTDTQVGARLDIMANGFWGGKFERAFFDVRFFNPFSPSYRKPLLSSVYRQHDKVKKRHYEQRIQEIEHSSFTPLVFSSTGGMGPITTVFNKRLASLLAAKWEEPYSTTIGWLRSRLSFSLLP